MVDNHDAEFELVTSQEVDLILGRCFVLTSSMLRHCVDMKSS
jgi:hypothetical protein